MSSSSLRRPEAALHRNTAPDPLQTTEELAIIEREITRFRCVVQGNPKNAMAWDTLGTYYKSAQRYREAILAYQQAVAVDPSKAPYHHRLGIMYSIVGRDEDAMKAFQDALEIDPNHSLANAGLGGYYRKMGLEELAQKHIGRAMKNLYNSENEYNKACFEALCGNVEQSIELLKIALKNKQTYVDWVLRDPDLDSIRRDPRFKQLIADYMA
jgi:tetratricopeptide (TPR) repeat protein